MSMGYSYINIILCDINILTQSNVHGLHLHQQYLMRDYHTNQSNVNGLHLHKHYLMRVYHTNKSNVHGLH